MYNRKEYMKQVLIWVAVVIIWVALVWIVTPIFVFPSPPSFPDKSDFK